MDDKREGAKKVGAGRGSLLLEMMRRQKLAEAGSSDLPTPESSIPQTSASSVVSTTQSVSQTSDQPRTSTSSSSMGRGVQFLMALKKTSATSEASSSASSPTIGQGRASPLTLIKKLSTVGTSSLAETESSSVPKTSGDAAGVLGKLSDLSVYDIKSSTSQQESLPLSRQGISGKKVDLTANYIDIEIRPGMGLYQYEVKFSPDVDSRGLRRKLLNQHSAALGKTKTFDGVLLYLPQKLPQNRTVLQSEHPNDGSPVELTVIYKKEQTMGENVQFFNILINRIMRALKLVRVGRQNFNPQCAHAVPQHHLEVWPGYVTAINEYEGGLKLCIDAKHRVMRTDTVHDLMREIYGRRSANFRDLVMTELIGNSVLTKYNNKSYRIDDIAWDKNPNYTFESNEGKTTLIDYYRNHWNLEIKDHKQPLLVHRGKVKAPTGETEERLILLVPELCFIAGLTDSIRSDFRVMKDLDAVTKINPTNRRDVIKRFIEEVQKNEVTREILSEWGLVLKNDTTCITGRTLDVETIIFGNNKSCRPNNADWTRFAVSNPVLRNENLIKWYVLCTQRDSKCTHDFISQLRKVSQTMGIEVSEPHVIILKDDRTESYIRELRQNIDKDADLMVIIFPSNRTDRYAAVKKLCCVECPIPSQVVMSRTISRADKLKSISEKIALQINCKLGGALWTLKIPFENCMICGIDVYHSGTEKRVRGSVAGFVASLDRHLTSWFSKACMQGKNQELIDLLQTCLLSAINAYEKKNGRRPDRIIVYRDGVGDGQLEVVRNYEVQHLLQTFANVDPGYKPQLSIIVVQKRINTRIFAFGRNGLENPGPGTIVDSCVTRRNYYDFFLVSQNIRQGTVTPTHYIVIYDGTTMKPDHVQRLTYKLCHLYYNWPGTIRVPAPCQYAHKLVYLVGQNIQMEPHASLSNMLFYL